MSLTLISIIQIRIKKCYFIIAQFHKPVIYVSAEVRVDILRRKLIKQVFYLVRILKILETCSHFLLLVCSSSNSYKKFYEPFKIQAGNIYVK